MRDVRTDVTSTKKPGHFFLLGPSQISTGFAYALATTVTADLIVYKTCLVSMNINETECLTLRNNAGSPEAQNLRAEVERYASIIVMTNYLMKSIVPAVLCLFLGPWSDKGGRRPPLLASFAGAVLMYVLLSLISDWNISPWYLLAGSIPAIVVGGFFSMKLALICYVSDTSVGKTRMFQMALLEATLNVGNLLGGLIGPLIYKNYGYVNVFRTAAICCIFSFIYVYFFIPETVKNTSKKSIGGIFKISFVKELVNSVVRRRNGFNRSVVWLAIFVLTINAISYYGDATIKFLFTRLRLGWDVQHFLHFDAADAVLRIAGLCVLLLHGHFSVISDITLAGVSELSALSGVIAKSFAWKSWHMYLSSVIAIFGTIIIPVMRSVIAKFVPAEDVGKVFSLVTLLETLSSLAGPAIYTLIYSNYLPPIYPAPVYIFASVSVILSFLCLVFIGLKIRKCKIQATYVAAPQEDLQS